MPRLRRVSGRLSFHSKKTLPGPQCPDEHERQCYQHQQRRAVLGEAREAPEDAERHGGEPVCRVEDAGQRAERQDEEESDREVRVDDAGMRAEVRIKCRKRQSDAARSRAEATSGLAAHGEEQREKESDERQARAEENRFGGRPVLAAGSCDASMR